MLHHTFLLIYRNFRRFKSTFFINLIGLSAGLACTLLIYLWISDELQVDKYHQKDGRLFQVMEHRDKDGGIQTSASGLSAEAIAREIPQVESAVTVTPPDFFPKFTLRVPGKNVRAVGKYVDTDFFNVFSYNLLEGNENQVLQDKNAIVLSEETALRLFNSTENLVGTTVEWQLPGFTRSCLVTGIFKGVPANSTEPFDFVLTFASFRDLLDMGQDVNWQTNSPFHAFVVLKEGTDPGQIDRTLARVLKSKNEKASHITLFLKPFSERYLYGTYVNGQQAGGRIEYVKLFSVIAAFILLIACINFMNLSTAKASRRVREVGIKKVVGAARETLVLQYLGESLLMTFLSLLLAVLVVALVLPQFNSITGKALSLPVDARLISVFLGITLLTGLLAGSYPALYLSGFKPALILKGRFSSPAGELVIRKGLVVFQFALSVIFIVSVLVVYKQIEFVQSKNLGFDKDNLIYFETEGKVAENAETFLAGLKNLPGVVNASSMFGYIINPYKASGGNTAGGGGSGNKSGGKSQNVEHSSLGVNYDMIETLGLSLKFGRSFSRNFASDSTKIVVNEAFAEAMGKQNPVGEVANGKEILGVVKNFHFQSLHQEVTPTAFRIDRQFTSTVVVKIRVGMERETLERLGQFYKTYNPGFVFDYKFLDQDYQALYTAEKRVSVLSRYFAGLAILISCLGLFGLAAFSAERRRKEIGVRKVFGASEKSIIYLLSGDFGKLVFGSILIALPVSYLLAKGWLDNFAYRIELEAWYFVAAGAIALFIAGLTVGTQALRAARISSSQCLKEE
jgi:ABC-type antimicrobial peptide transport system permease subunit